MSEFNKKLLVPDYIYASRVDIVDIPFFEEAFYQEVEFYTDAVKQTEDRFKHGLRIGYVYMKHIKKNLFKLPESYSIESLGEQGFEWRFVPRILERFKEKKAVCAGAGTNITFELSFAHEIPGIEVILLDPSPHAIKHIKGLALPDNMEFVQVGLSNEDTVLRFHKPSTHGVGSLSALGLQPSEEYFELPVKRVQTILDEHKINESSLCYLKFDIEGSEHAVIEDVIASKLRPCSHGF